MRMIHEFEMVGHYSRGREPVEVVRRIHLWMGAHLISSKERALLRKLATLEQSLNDRIDQAS